uniref:Uncharacterized protein n=1 Tax=Chrysemys picta bellii TaxID=8478 RepID=A0A8C3HTK6_CHRPI
MGYDWGATPSPYGKERNRGKLTGPKSVAVVEPRERTQESWFPAPPALTHQSPLPSQSWGENPGVRAPPLQVDMITLAKQIIEATPEHIKQEGFSSAAEVPLRERSGNMGLSETMSWLAGYLENVDHPLQAPLGELPFDRLPPPSTAASWAEFLNASANGKMESEFALLTLSDHEQRELYEAARVIQTAFRKYKGRRLKEQQETAAAVIQRCYRKYKQLTWIALKVTSRRARVTLWGIGGWARGLSMTICPAPPSLLLLSLPRGTFLTKKQDQAARKIMRFLRRCRHRMKELKQSKEVESLQKRGLAT